MNAKQFCYLLYFAFGFVHVVKPADASGSQDPRTFIYIGTHPEHPSVTPDAPIIADVRGLPISSMTFGRIDIAQSKKDSCFAWTSSSIEDADVLRIADFSRLSFAALKRMEPKTNAHIRHIIIENGTCEGSADGLVRYFPLLTYIVFFSTNILIRDCPNLDDAKKALGWSPEEMPRCSVSIGHRILDKNTAECERLSHQSPNGTVVQYFCAKKNVKSGDKILMPDGKLISIK